MSPTASSKAKMFRSVSVGDGIHLSEPADDPPLTASCSPVKEAPPTLTAEVPSGAAVATPPLTAVAPVVVSLSSSLSGQGTQAAPPTRTLHARVPGGSRPLPDKPCLSSFSPSWPPSVPVSSLTPPPQEEETPAGPGADSGQNFFPLLSLERAPYGGGSEPRKQPSLLSVQMSQSVLRPAER